MNFFFEKLNLGANQNWSCFTIACHYSSHSIVLTIWFHLLYRLGFCILCCCIVFLFSEHPLAAKKYLIMPAGCSIWTQFLKYFWGHILLQTYCGVPNFSCGREVIEENINHCLCAWKGHLYDLQLLQQQKIYLDVVLIHCFLGTCMWLSICEDCRYW